MNEKTSIIIFGAGGHGKVVLDILLESKIEVLGFIDEDLSKKGQKISGFTILGGWSCLKDEKNISIVLGIGNNLIREKVFMKAKNMGLKIISAVHPGAIISKSAKIGVGVVIMPGAIVNSAAVVEDGAVVNTGATVDHDCWLERFCQVWPGANLAGTVRVGEFSYVGTGAAVIHNINIGKNVMIGAGAVVVNNVPDNVTVVGVPAKEKQRNK